jgi:hypothetical protein
MMRKVLLSVIALFAVASAFTPVAKPITTSLPRSPVVDVPPRHRRATIVNDGKANGRFLKRNKIPDVPKVLSFLFSPAHYDVFA